MTHTDAFLQDILEHPHDDTPRLILADWLEDHSNEARSEFIRVQINLARDDFRCTCTYEYEHGIGCQATREKGLRKREGELLEFPGSNPCAWFPRVALVTVNRNAMAGRTPCGLIRRGFVEAISLPTVTFLEHAQTLFLTTPILEVKLTGHHPTPNDSQEYFWTIRPRRWCDNNLPSTYDVPPALMPYLRDRNGALACPPTIHHYPFTRYFHYQTTEQAHAALSVACVAYGRNLAGLPPL